MKHSVFFNSLICLLILVSFPYSSYASNNDLEQIKKFESRIESLKTYNLCDSKKFEYERGQGESKLMKSHEIIDFLDENDFDDIWKGNGVVQFVESNRVLMNQLGMDTDSIELPSIKGFYTRLHNFEHKIASIIDGFIQNNDVSAKNIRLVRDLDILFFPSEARRQQNGDCRLLDLERAGGFSVVHNWGIKDSFSYEEGFGVLITAIRDYYRAYYQGNGENTTIGHTYQTNQSYSEYLPLSPRQKYDIYARPYYVRRNTSIVYFYDNLTSNESIVLAEIGALEILSTLRLHVENKRAEISENAMEEQKARLLVLRNELVQLTSELELNNRSRHVDLEFPNFHLNFSCGDRFNVGNKQDYFYSWYIYGKPPHAIVWEDLPPGDVKDGILYRVSQNEYFQQAIHGNIEISINGNKSILRIPRYHFKRSNENSGVSWRFHYNIGSMNWISDLYSAYEVDQINHLSIRQGTFDTGNIIDDVRNTMKNCRTLVDKREELKASIEDLEAKLKSRR